MSITINGRTVDFNPGDTVLKAARQAGIHIPSLCALDCAVQPAGACRVCIVEVEGMPRVQTSCTLLATHGMVVHTHSPKVLKLRRNIVELLLASHPDDCLYCGRNGNCELAALALQLGVRERHYLGAKKAHALDVSSPALMRDPNKCILCGRCVTVCHLQQKVGAIDFVGRGFRTQVAPGFASGINVSGCILCGQCVRACPTGALMEKSAVADVLAALADPNKVVVAQVAPAVPATLLEAHPGLRTVPGTLEAVAGAFRRAGFQAVFDTTWAADLTIMEEASELVQRVTSGGALPMFTSCSPGWIRYVELHRPDLIPHLSTCKSPQQMAGSAIKAFYPQRVDLQGKGLYVVSLMPCTAKKYEAHDLGDVDAVLTTREVEDLLARCGLSLDTPGIGVPLDAPFAESTGAGRLFGGTGGVMEAAVRTAYKLVTGHELHEGPKLTDLRGTRGVKTLDVQVAAGLTLHCAVVNGLGEVGPILEEVTAGKSPYHFVEVMTCPGGCVGGGGQPYATDGRTVLGRLDRLYEVDRNATHRRSHENEEVQSLYRDHLEAPLSEQSHHLLHRRYTPGERD